MNVALPPHSWVAFLSPTPCETHVLGACAPTVRPLSCEAQAQECQFGLLSRFWDKVTLVRALSLSPQKNPFQDGHWHFCRLQGGFWGAAQTTVSFITKNEHSGLSAPCLSVTPPHPTPEFKSLNNFSLGQTLKGKRSDFSSGKMAHRNFLTPASRTREWETGSQMGKGRVMASGTGPEHMNGRVGVQKNLVLLQAV